MAYKYRTEEIIAIAPAIQRKLDEATAEGWRLISVIDISKSRSLRLGNETVNDSYVLLMFEKLIRAPRKKKVVD